MGLFDWIADVLGFTAPSFLEIMFIGCAVIGTAFFLLMMAIMLIGGVAGGIIDTAFDTDFSMDTDLSFELFSVQGIAAAVMIFGQMGLVVLSATDQELIAVLAGGFSAVGSMYMVKYMMQGMIKLQVDGTMKHTDAIGVTGQVYSRIRKNNTGEVQVSVDGTLRTLEARAKDKDMLIPSGELIIVTDVIGATLVVEPLGTNEELTSTEEN